MVYMCTSPLNYRAHFEKYNASAEEIFLLAKLGAKNPKGKKMFKQCHWNGKHQEFTVTQICALIVMGYQINDSDFNLKSFPSRRMFQWHISHTYFDKQVLRIILESGFQPKFVEPTRNDEMFMRRFAYPLHNVANKLDRLKRLTWQPLALQRLAANVIRTSLQPNAVAGLPNLDIPPILKPYIIHGLTEEAFRDFLCNANYFGIQERQVKKRRLARFRNSISRFFNRL